MSHPHHDPLFLLTAILLVWLVQPWVLQYCLSKDDTDRSSSTLLAAIIIAFCSSTYYLADQLHQSLEAFHLKPIVFILLWYPVGMQIFRYLHLWSVGIRVFRDHFGLTDRSRMTLFMLSTPTILFCPPKKDDNNNKKDENLMKDFYIALMDILITVAACGLLLTLQVDRWMPDGIQRLLRVYIMGFSTSIIRVLLECPIRWWLQTDPRIQRIIPVYNQPYLTTSPRELWRRWSCTAGYHLRHAYYEPILQRQRHSFGDKPAAAGEVVVTRKVLATIAPFLVNCLFHIYWWSMAIKGEIDYVYWYLLFVYPLTSFILQDVVIDGNHRSSSQQRQRSPPSRTQRVANFGLLWIGFCMVGEPMSSANGLPISLTAVCRANVGLPPL